MSEDNLDSILREGLHGPSCWSLDERVVAAYTVAQQMPNGGRSRPCYFGILAGSMQGGPGERRLVARIVPRAKS